MNGSPEYELTLKHWAMKSGQPIFAVRASARPISGNGCTGLPTPRSSDNVQTNLDQIAEKGSSWLGQGRGATVSTMAQPW